LEIRRLSGLGFDNGLCRHGPQTQNHRLHRDQRRWLYRPGRRVGGLARAPAAEGQLRHGCVLSLIDTILWGRKTCDVALDFQKKGVSRSAFDTKVKNYVFTRGPLPSAAPAGTEFVNESITAFTKRLREQKGKDIWMMGGAGIIASFLDAGEIDEFMIHVIPTFIGEGIPLMSAAHRTVSLKLISCKKFPDGVVKLHYAVRK